MPTVSYEILPLTDLRGTPGNPQKMTDEQFQGLVKSLRKDGWILDAPVVWRRDDGTLQIISGHHRIQAAILAGINETGCKVIEGIDEAAALMKVAEANLRRGTLDLEELNDFVSNIADQYSLETIEIYDGIGLAQDVQELPGEAPSPTPDPNPDSSNKCPECGYEW